MRQTPFQVWKTKAVYQIEYLITFWGTRSQFS